MTEKRKAVLFRLFLALCSFVFLLLFARYSSPLTPQENGYDAAFFRLVGQRMTEGYLPYRDFFDMKGPCLFFLEYLGQLIIPGRMGAFLLEWVNLTAALLIVCRIFDRLKVRSYPLRILLLLPCLWMAAGTFEGGNMTEELSLPALFLCLDLWLRFYLCHSGAGYHPPMYAAVYGACFMFLALIRVTNAALIGAAVLSLIVWLLLHRSLKSLAFNALAFVGGACFVCLPVYVFYALNGLAREMMYQVFVFGFKYGSEYGFVASLARAARHAYHYVFILLPLVLVLLFRKKDSLLNMLAVFSSLFTFFACIPSNQYNHYLVLGIPLIVLSEVMILICREEARPRGAKCIAAVCLLVFSMLLHIQTTGGSVLYSYRLLTVPGFTAEAGVEDIADRISEDERDKVFCYNIGAFWYIRSGINPYIRYSGWHKHYIKLDPGIAEELQALLEEDPPSCIVVRAHKSLPRFMKDLLKSGYFEDYRNSEFVLYKRNTP